MDSFFFCIEKNEFVEGAKVKYFYPDYGLTGVISFYCQFLFVSVAKLIGLNVRLSSDAYFFYI